MSRQEFASVCVHFSELEDPRSLRTQLHPLINVVVIGLCAVICGCSHFTQFHAFGKAKRDWFGKFLDLSNGIPSHDVFNAVFARMKPQQFEGCLLSWIKALHEVTEGQILAIDGKTLRGSYVPGDSKAAVHRVSAWATANHISLGSLAVEEKSNEITAIPKLLEMIDVAGALVTIDAMGCQKEIARTIRREGAHYLLAAKGNQPKLFEAIVAAFDKSIETDFAGVACRRFHTTETGHGRTDDRSCVIVPVPDDFPVRDDWQDLKALGMAVRISEQDGQTTCEARYYIASRFLSGRKFAEASRGHWGIENNLHWQLDVTFREDHLRLHKGHAPTNMSLLMRAALSLLKNEPANTSGLATKRLTAGWNDTYLGQVLTGKAVKTR